MHRIHVLLALALFTTPQFSEAQQRIDFGIQCLVAPFRACLSVHVGTYFDETRDLTELRFRISNLQGLTEYQTGPVGLKSITFNGLQSRTGWGMGAFNPQGIAFGNAVAHAWPDMPNDPRYSPDGLATYNWHMDGVNYVFGCTVPPYHPGWPDDSTCGGYINYSSYVIGDEFRITKETTLTLDWIGTNTEGDAFERGSCTTGSNCATVTPEPISIVLMGSGLAGIAAARRRRKRNPA